MFEILYVMYVPYIKQISTLSDRALRKDLWVSMLKWIMDGRGSSTHLYITLHDKALSSTSTSHFKQEKVRKYIVKGKNFGSRLQFDSLRKIWEKTRRKRPN